MLRFFTLVVCAAGHWVVFDVVIAAGHWLLRHTWLFFLISLMPWPRRRFREEQKQHVSD